MSAQKSAPDWHDILPEPFVALVIGKRGGGKTATGHRLMEQFGGPDMERDAYIMGYPEDEADELPEWIDTLPATVGLDDWPENSVVLVHEAHHIAHARESQQAENLSIDKLVTVSRHRDSDIVFETQQTQRLDRNFPAASDAIIVKQPALMQEEFERRQMKTIISEANDVFDKYRTVTETDTYTHVEWDDETVKHAYVHADTFRGEYPYDIELADHWSDDISKAYSDNDMFETGEGEGEDDDAIGEDKQDALDEVAEWEAENRPLSFDVQGADYSDTTAQPHTLSALERLGFIEKVYSSNSKPNRYRLTEKGWAKTGVEEPDGPVVQPDE